MATPEKLAGNLVGAIQKLVEFLEDHETRGNLDAMYAAFDLT